MSWGLRTCLSHSQGCGPVCSMWSLGSPTIESRSTHRGARVPPPWSLVHPWFVPRGVQIPPQWSLGSPTMDPGFTPSLFHIEPRSTPMELGSTPMEPGPPPWSPAHPRFVPRAV